MEHDLIREAYRKFNERDADAVLALMCEDVDWAHALTGDRIRGRAELRRLWLLQWTSLHVTAEPMRIYEEDGRTVVVTHHIVREPGGFLVSEDDMEEVYTLRDGLIARMDYREVRKPETAND